MVKRLLMLTTVSIVLYSSLSQAAGHFYWTVGSGGVVPSIDSQSKVDSNPVMALGSNGNPLEITLQQVKWQNNYEPGYEVNVAFGRHVYTHGRMEAEFVYQNVRRNIIGTYNWVETAQMSGDLFQNMYNVPVSDYSIRNRATLYALMLNGYYDFENKTRWTPSIGLGIGAAYLMAPQMAATGSLAFNDISASFSGTMVNHIVTPSLTGAAFAMQLKLGINYKMTDAVSITAQYRALATTFFRNTGSTIITDVDAPSVFSVSGKVIQGMLNHSFNLNFVYTM